jgi:hypothetical protein
MSLCACHHHDVPGVSSIAGRRAAIAREAGWIPETAHACVSQLENHRPQALTLLSCCRDETSAASANQLPCQGFAIVDAPVSVIFWSHAHIEISSVLPRP